LIAHIDIHAINLWEAIQSFKAHGKKRWWNVLIPLSLVMHGLNIFGPTIGPSWYIPPPLSNICFHF
jgi:hypothetical protein